MSFREYVKRIFLYLSYSNDDYDQFYEPHVTQVVVRPYVPNPISSKFQERYKIFKLPPLLHDFPPNYFKYFPKFDGELENIAAEKHIHAFECFIDPLEIEQDDVCMRAFASLQGKAKKWFRSLLARSIANFQ